MVGAKRGVNRPNLTQKGKNKKPDREVLPGEYAPPYLNMRSSCVHLILLNSQEFQNSEFLQKVTKETKSRIYCPGPSFPSLPSVKSEWDGWGWLRLRRARAIVAGGRRTPAQSEYSLAGWTKVCPHAYFARLT
jgi:hypothetical protein